MKKFVKPLVVAASVAAIAGIGAVSFAKWTGNHSSATSSGANGTVSLLGFNTNTATGFTGLLPYDQVDSAAPSATNNTLKTISLPTVTPDSKAYDVTVSSSDVATNLTKGGKLYVYVGTSAATNDFAGSATAEWKEVDSTGAKFEFASSDTTLTAYFVLTSNDTDEMSATYTLTFAIAEHTT